MKTQPSLTRAPRPPHEPRGPAHQRSWTDWLAPFTVLGVAAVIVMAVYLSIYPRRELDVPMGWDMSEYLWRTTVAQDAGIHEVAGALPQITSAVSGRPALPAIGATLSSLLGVSVFTLSFVLSSAMAAVIGLSAAAFVGVARRSSLWEMAAVALAVSLSSFVARLIAPEAYMDTMFAAAVLLAALVAFLLALERWAAMLPAIALIGAGAVVHWSFFTFFAAVLVGTAALLLPRSWKEWRSGQTHPLGSSSARTLEMLSGGALLGAGVIYGVLGNAAPRPRLDISEFRKKIRRDLPKYKLPFTLPAAAAGAASLVIDSRPPAPKRRASAALTVLLSWCAVVGLGYVGMVYLGLHVPAHRFLSFGLAIPILGILAVLWLARWAARTAKALGVVIVALAIAAAGYFSYGQLLPLNPWTPGAQIQEAEAAAAYLDAARVPPSRPVVVIAFTTDGNIAGLWGNGLRAGLPAERVPEAYLYIGSPEDYLAGRPGESGLSRSRFEQVRRLFPRDPVALILPSFNNRYFANWAAEHPQSVISGRVGVVDGPPPPRGFTLDRSSLSGSDVGVVPPVVLGLLAVAVVFVLIAVGLGWALFLLGRWIRPSDLIAVAPGIGVAVLVVGAVVFDRLGLRLVGLGGAAVPVIVAVVGWLAFALHRRLRPPASPTSSAG